MFFGLTNSPASFQIMMNAILKDLIDQGHVVVYMDDILVFTKDLEEHQQIVDEVLKRLKENDLFLKPQKYFFEQKEGKFLGLIISEEDIRMDPKKVEGVQNWPRPKKVKEVQAFLGFANFYCRFVKDFAKITTPLNHLTRKDQEWKWSEDEELAFNDLKERFTSEPILHYLDPSKPLRVEADSSGFATGGILSVLEDDQSGIHAPSSLSLSMKLNETMKSMIEKCSLLCDALKTGVTTWRESRNNSRFFRT